MIDYGEVLKSKALRPRPAVSVSGGVKSLAEALGDKTAMDFKMRSIRARHGMKEYKKQRAMPTSGGVDKDIF